MLPALFAASVLVYFARRFPMMTGATIGFCVVMFGVVL